MRRAEYGSRGEVMIRYGVMATVILVLSVTLEQRLVIAWGIAYAVIDASLAGVMHMGPGRHPRATYLLALGLYLLSGLCFLALPIYLIAIGETVVHGVVASAGIIGLLLYTLQRPLRQPGLMIIDCVHIVLLGLALSAVLMPRLDSWSDRVPVILVMLAVGLYYIGSLVSGLRTERTLREANQRYAASQKARALNQFVGGVAHDFNNQLTAILGHLDLVETLESPAERGAALQQIRLAADRAALTVQQLLASSGRTRLNTAPLQMADFLYGLGEVLTDLLDPDMTVEVVPPDVGLTVLADADMLETCAIQLCLNAQDATGGRGLIRLSCERLPAAQVPLKTAGAAFIALIIEDDGPGVPPEALPLLAEPFYTTKSASEGRGLGLSAVDGFARQSGGALRLEPGIQGGLRAILYLPEASSDPPLS